MDQTHRTIWLLVIPAYLAGAPVARAHQPREGDIWATIGPHAYRTNTRSALIDNPTQFGGAIIAEGDVDHNGGVEIAMIYLDQLYVRKRGDEVIAESIKRMHISTGYRHWFIPELSAGLAFYSAYSMGDATVVFDTRTSGEPLLTSARTITDYGFDFSVQGEVAFSDRVRLVADARYALAVTKMRGENADIMSLLLGMKYLVPKRG